MKLPDSPLLEIAHKFLGGGSELLTPHRNFRHSEHLSAESILTEVTGNF